LHNAEAVFDRLNESEGLAGRLYVPHYADIVAGWKGAEKLLPLVLRRNGRIVGYVVGVAMHCTVAQEGY